MGGSNGKPYAMARSRILAPALELDLRCAATARVPVLISAEREVATWLARMIHDLSGRRDAPFQVLDAAEAGWAAPAELTRIFDAACTEGVAGTLFLPEIENASPAFRSELMDWVTSVPMPDEWPALVVSAGTALEDRVYAGLFEDRLFYRLNSIHIRLTTGAAEKRGADRPQADDARRDLSAESGGSLPRHASEGLEQPSRHRAWLALANLAIV
jgi:DNA-binding NtrC family response regulator